jgi:hypothetical protein
MDQEKFEITEIRSKHPLLSPPYGYWGWIGYLLLLGLFGLARVATEHFWAGCLMGLAIFAVVELLRTDAMVGAEKRRNRA